MLTGDHHRLKFIMQFIADTGSPRSMQRYHRRAGLLTRRYLQEGFDKGRDPYGKPWKPSAKQGSRTMMRSGKLKDGIRYRSSARRVAFWEQARNERGVRYGPIMQKGMTIRAKGRAMRFELNGKMIATKRVNIPPRRFMLEPDRPIPTGLSNRIEDGVWDDIKGRWMLR